MISKDKKQRIKLCAVITVAVIAIAFAIFTVIKYGVEGEKTVPFKIGKIIVISSASTTDAATTEASTSGQAEQQEGSQQQEGQPDAGQQQGGQAGEEQQQESQTGEAQQQENQPEESQPESSQPEASEPEEKFLWNENVVQTNDLYIYIDKNNDYKESEIIKSVRIENIKILENVKVGKIQVYMPNSLNDGLYKYVSDYVVNSKLTYNGAPVDNKKALEIGNQGGCICVSFANVGLGQYKSNDDSEIEQGATILQKMNIANEDLKFKISFDLVIEVENKSYKTELTLELPVDELVGQKETHREITDLEKVIFKRL